MHYFLERYVPTQSERQQIVTIGNYFDDFASKIRKVNSLYIANNGDKTMHYYIKLVRYLRSSDYNNLKWFVVELESSSVCSCCNDCNFLYYMFENGVLKSIYHKQQKIEHKSVLFESCNLYIPGIIREFMGMSESEKRLCFNDFVINELKYDKVETEIIVC